MRSSAACLTLLFILSLSVVSIIDLQPVRAETTTRYYLQSSNPTMTRLPLGGPTRNVTAWSYRNVTVFNMDIPTPHGDLLECVGNEWEGCDFSTRPLVDAHSFDSFKLHVYVKGNASVAYISVAIGESLLFGNPILSGRLTQYVWYQYRYPYRPISPSAISTEGELTVLDVPLMGIISPVEVRAGAGLVFHFGVFAPRGWDPGGNRPPPISNCSSLLFGDSEHASYIETDAVELQGQPVPEFPSFLIMLPVILALTILLRRERNRRCPVTKLAVDTRCY